MKLSKQQLDLLFLLESKEWVCVEEMTKVPMVDYRKRLGELKRKGYELADRRCQQHNYHRGGSKEWSLIGRPMREVWVHDERMMSDGSVVRVPRLTYEQI